MDQNQIVDNELQKAIDEITNTTSVDPTFSDPVAAPSTLPEDAEMGPIEPVGPFPAPEPNFDFSEVNAPAPEMTDITAPVMPEAPVVEEAPATPATEEAPAGIKEIKDSAIRDLLPLLDKMNISPSQKFRICRDAFESLKDYTAINPAYRAAKEIADDKERADALLYIIESIDRID